jgi:hypothetical protein
MDPETKRILEKTLKLTEENNVMLHKVRGVQKRMALLGFLRFLIIVGVAFGLFYYLEPYLTKIMDFFVSVGGIQKDLNSGGIPIGDILKKF